MIPPVDVAVLQQNPKFKAFYTELVKQKLNEDGTTKDLKKERGAEEVTKSLTKLRVESAKRSIIVDGLHHISSNTAELPPELREVIQLVCAQLSGLVPPADQELLHEDFESFMEHITPICKALSAHLSTTAHHITQIAHPDKPSSEIDALVPSLPNHLTTLSQNIKAQSTDLSSSKTELAVSAAALLSTHRALLETAIRTLEQVQHGVLARHARARAEHLATVAKGMELKLAITTHPTTLAPTLPPELFDALKNYSANLAEQKRKLLSRQTSARRVLDGYENEGGAEMKEMVRRYAMLQQEKERVKDEVGRLEG